MTRSLTDINLMAAWLLIAVGFVGGFVLGLNFHRDDWLGGYGSLRRRLYRLSHIAALALGVMNLLFAFTVRTLPAPSVAVHVASWGFIIGAVTMPLACLAMAHRPTWRALFLVPVVSLVTAALITFTEVLRA